MGDSIFDKHTQDFPYLELKLTSFFSPDLIHSEYLRLGNYNRNIPLQFKILADWVSEKIHYVADRWWLLTVSAHGRKDEQAPLHLFHKDLHSCGQNPHDLITS